MPSLTRNSAARLEIGRREALLNLNDGYYSIYMEALA